MKEILEDLLKKIEEREDEISFIYNKITIEKLKLSILQNQIREVDGIASNIYLEIWEAYKNLNKVLQKVLKEG